jgi:hypothetical protein
MRERRQLQASTTIADGSDLNIDFSVPKWAVGAIFFIEVTAMSGTTETFDFKLQYALPNSTSFLDVTGASIVQLVAAANKVLILDPRITVDANDHIAVPLSSSMRAVIATGFGGADESYTFAIAAEFYS